MSGGSTGKGGVADANLNVVPFIDLLACIICFLLISAAWTQMARIDVDQALPKASPKPPPTPPLPEGKINVVITPTGHMVNLWNADKIANPHPEHITVTKISATGDFRLCRGKGTGADCAGPNVESFKKYDYAKLREKLATYLRDCNLPTDNKVGGKNTKVMVAAIDSVQYLHLIRTLDQILLACKEADKKETCLNSPSVGDVNLLRTEGFTSFE
ncbi:MAG: hypothetical protein EXR77_10925 [Myxococcales bacterium]|nr:hypothetical protein [Myxococcales bacterium]